MSEKANDPNARKTRPPIQIYRPPGLRSGNTTPSNNQPTFDSIKSSNVTKDRSKKEVDQLSNASSESQNSTTKKSDRPKKESITRVPSSKKSTTINKDDIISLIQKLNLSNEEAVINDFITSIESVEVASRLSHFITRYAIEENKQNQRICSQLSAIILDCPISGQAFYNGLVSSLNQYFDCADKLRSKHFRVWLNYLSFLNDLYSNIGFRFDNELAEIIFKVFNYLLGPTLQELKIEELECLIAVLLNLGSDLERDCTSELSELKNLIRDALILSQESWARKMILLMLELSASNFCLTSEANEFYFQ